LKTRARDGFTLIELLIVVVIIGILAAIAIPKFSATREKAYISALKADLRNLANLQAVYYNEAFSYSSTVSDLGFTNSEGVVVTVVEANNTGWSASASHLGMPSESCAIYHGSASVLSPANVESSVQCSR